MKGHRIFLTGGAGFIGSHLVARLADDNRITVYDTMERNALARSRYAAHHNVRVIRGNVLDGPAVTEAMAGHDTVIHLAAIAGVDTVIKSPTRTMRINIEGTQRVLDAAIENHVSHRFVNFSTSEVFGAYTYRSSESDNTQAGAVGSARWTYAVAKLAAEHLVNSYGREFGLPTVSVRPFNIYGPGQVGEGAIHHFVLRALRNQEIQIHGNGDQIRSWCYIDDIIDCLLRCLTCDEAVGEVFNIGNPRGTVTIYGLALAILRVCHSNSPIRFVAREHEDVELRVPSIAKAQQLLGYEPKIDLEEGIRRTADWYWTQMQQERMATAAV